jgi:hypothetical protein
MKKIFLAIISLTLISFNTCDDNPVNGDDLKPGRRDYVWTADTLWTADFFGIHDVWGSSPNSIWMVAAGTSAKDCLWYYDGVKWARSNQILNSSLNTVFGVNPDEIWMGDSYGTIWRNTGSGWQMFQQIAVSGYDRIIIASIYGATQNNLYAIGGADNYDGSGYKGIILNYDGTDWKLLNIQDIRVGFHRIKKMKNGNYLIEGSNDDNGFLEKLFVFDGGNNLKEIYSDYTYPYLDEMNGDAYIAINRKIYKCINDKLELWKDFSSTSYHSTVLGRNEKDFFGAGYDGIMHYNGADFKILFQTELEKKGVLIFEKDVFFFAYTEQASGYNYIMIRGTLNEQ